MPRTYVSDRRAEQARQTRRRVLAVAGRRFATRGYAATTIRAVAADAGVSVPTVELHFGSKVRLLREAIDVAIAGDDEPVAMLDRTWADRARAATSVPTLLDVVAAVLAPAQTRSSGLLLALFEAAAAADGPAGLAELAELAADKVAQRRAMAGWCVAEVARRSPLREAPEAAADSLWLLMDPAVHHRLTRQLGWDETRYRDWFARSAEHLLVPDPLHPQETR